MIQNFQEYIKNIDNISPQEKRDREKSLELFNKKGFPNKKLEEWKFTDIKKVIQQNFNELNPNNKLVKIKEINFIKDFEHNHILTINGNLYSHDFKYEDKDKVKIEKFKKELSKNNNIDNSLLDLNDALFSGGYFLEVLENYKLKKPLIVYNYFSNDIRNKIISNKNLIKLNKNSYTDFIELSIDDSNDRFFYNNYTNIILKNEAILKKYIIQSNKSKSVNYKFIKVFLENNSNFESYIFSSGLEFNKIDKDIDVDGKNASCTIQSSLLLNGNSHQEIKTKINHLKPNSKSFQKIKNVINDNCKAVYQGKIFVKDIAQKTDAYQLSKALILKDKAEFNAKPELEIYADDVKCSHGSTSGNIDEEAIYYLMTRGISKQEAILLLTEAFLFEIFNSIENEDIKIFLEKNLKKQIYEYKIN
tara:strand:+ start:152 stop:1405 length:1254 start_codon:yes stop_codon:yes gene_type:complete